MLMIAPMLDCIIRSGREVSRSRKDLGCDQHSSFMLYSKPSGRSRAWKPYFDTKCCIRTSC